MERAAHHMTAANDHYVKPVKRRKRCALCGHEMGIRQGLSGMWLCNNCLEIDAEVWKERRVSGQTAVGEPRL